MPNFIISARDKKTENGVEKYGSEPGHIEYLIVPEDATDILPSQKASSSDDWITSLTANKNVDQILIYVHGFNMDSDVTLRRHVVLKEGLKKQNWNGELVTFAWPSKQHTALYWEDRFDGLKVAFNIVADCIALLNKQINEKCTKQIHVIAHSTGALLIREAFQLAKMRYKNDNAVWMINQLVFIAGDISSQSMDRSDSDAIYEQCTRITNYFSNADTALQVSNIKRLGMANRVGRVGLPMASPEKAIDVNCTEYYNLHEDGLRQVVEKPAALSHSWYFWSDDFLKDLKITLDGLLDRNVIPTRRQDMHGEFHLKIKENL